MIIYLGMPYTNSPEANTLAAEQAGMRLQQQGHTVLIPHSFHHTAKNWRRYWAHDAGGDYWAKVGLAMLSACDALVLEGNWKKSKGCRREHKWAQAHGLTVYYGADKVPPDKEDEID